MKNEIVFPGDRKKAVTLSYDDNIRQDIRLAEICDKYGLKCTFNINGGIFLPSWLKLPIAYSVFSKKEAVGLFTDSPHEIATHGFLHPDYTRLSIKKARKNAIKDKSQLEQLFDRKIIGHAYPMGTYNDNVKKILKENGICYARTTKSTFDFKLPEDWFEWNPTCYHRDKEVLECVDRFLEADEEEPRLFYLWGHSYEFDVDQNWELIENIAKKLGNRDDIWYCTNGEFYQWVANYQMQD